MLYNAQCQYVYNTDKLLETMKAEWKDSRCILCLQPGALSCEHMIPALLGGKLECRFLCRNCNSTLGSDIESKVKEDPSIRVAVENLRPVLHENNPALEDKLINNQRFLIKSGSGVERAHADSSGQIKIRPRQADDGSFICPVDIAKRVAESDLQKRGLHNADIKAALLAFDEAPTNKIVEICPGYRIIEWRPEEVLLDFSRSQAMDSLVLLKIAYEFLALHLGLAIYDDAPQMREIRAALIARNRESSCFHVERFMASKYRPFHGICFEGNSPYAKVQIRLFGSLAFRVHFHWLAVNGPRFFYTHCLRSGDEWVDEQGA